MPRGLTTRAWYSYDSPGREIEVVSGFMASGAQVVVFSTGLGAPFGLPVVPVMKVTGNPHTAGELEDDIDVDVSGYHSRGRTHY